MKALIALISFAWIATVAAKPRACTEQALAAATAHQAEGSATENARKEFYRVGQSVRTVVRNQEWTQGATKATAYLELAAKFPCNWDYGNAIYIGNSVLGMAAFQRGEIAAAVDFLRRAGKSPGSPQLDTFGPNLELASALMKVGQRDVVAEHLREISAFWEMEDGRLACWQAEIAAGRQPNFSKAGWDLACYADRAIKRYVTK
jgi:hypothetical protein